jgi:carboxymethylenebutenolidase
MGDVKIPVNSGEFPVFVSIPERAEPRPGAVVLHDVGGMKEDLRNQTRWLAQEGFLAAVPNLYFRGGMMKCLFAIARDLKARRGPTYDDIEAVRAWLIRQEGCTGKIGVIGFCMGAEFARELSPGRRALPLALPPENEEKSNRYPSHSPATCSAVISGRSTACCNPFRSEGVR